MGSGASRKVSCPICLHLVRNKEFSDHFYDTHNRKCSKCGLFGFISDESFHKHYDEAHNVTKEIICPKCSSVLGSEEKLIEHLGKTHAFKIKNETLLRCPECQQSVKNEFDLVAHIRKKQKKVEKQRETTVNLSQPVKIIKCPINCQEKFNNADNFVQHLSSRHNFVFAVNKREEPESVNQHTCPNCDITTSNYKELIDHMQSVHIGNSDALIVCPKCSNGGGEGVHNNKGLFESSEALLKHLQTEHNFSSTVTLMKSNNESDELMTKRLPKVGDRILAMWEVSMWQYFHATIKDIQSDRITYEIDWDDGDTTGRFVKYQNIAIDRIPDENEIGIGSIILFPQGSYNAGKTQLTGGKRWHQGQITSVYKSDDNSTTLYDGTHTKGEGDGKFITYRGYSFAFKGFKREDFRVGPNVFDILADEYNTDSEDVDIYFSHFTNPRNEELNPSEIATILKSKGYSLFSYKDIGSDKELTKKLALMRNSKVFIACINDNYVKDETCRMEFQFAKSTLKKPVIPVVFGHSMDWQLSVVGMLISGELYIHMKDESVKEEKVEQILKTISAHVSNDKSTETITDKDSTDFTKKGNEDLFISYCWANSYLSEPDKAEENKAHEYRDPRLIKEKFFQHGFNPWLDIEQLKSGDQGVGLFEQLAAALKKTKAFIPCVSDEYAASANCRMEFQFACKALKKPVIPLIVGSGDKWSETVIGMLIRSDDTIQPIDLRNVTTSEELDLCLAEAVNRVKTLGLSQNRPQKQHSMKPKVGDHVVSHHFKHCYYMATVASYDASTMEYTVNWDDGDPTGKVQPYNQVALDVVPDLDDIGVGSIIFFPQGKYVATDGNNTGGVRYHEGVITKVNVDSSTNDVTVEGHHTHGEKDRKFCGYKGYAYEFQNVPLSNIRLAATALDTMT